MLFGRSAPAKHLRRLLIGGALMFMVFAILLPSVGRRTNCYLFRGDRLYFTQDHSGLHFVDTDDYWVSDAGMVGLPPETPFFCATSYIRWRDRWWGIGESFNHTLEIESPSGTGDPAKLAPTDLDHIYAQYAAHLRKNGVNRDTADLFRRGPGITMRINWKLAQSRAVTVLIVTLIAYGVGWFLCDGFASIFRRPEPCFDPESGCYIRCPNCKYDLAGLTSTVCPECGTECAPAGQQRP